MTAFDGAEVKLTNSDKVMYPATGTVKAQVVDYYRQVAPYLLPSIAGRPVTRKRWPGGVDEPAFFAKDLDPGTPSWMARTQIAHGSGPKFYPLLDSAAGLVWLAQMNALELHVPQWRIDPPTAPRRIGERPARFPDRVVFDLDPGPDVGLAECVQVALLIRDRLGWLGEAILPVTSGSKGLHLYVPMPGPITSEQASQWALQVAQQMEKVMPELVVSQMSKAIRSGKVFLDWSQNNGKKTTIAPYSLRGRESPTVAAPRTWAEITAPGLTQLTFEQVLDRLAAGIDPLADFSSTTEPEGLRLAAGEPVRSPFLRQPVARAGGPVAVTAVTSPAAAGKRTATRTRPARPKPTVAKRSAAPVRMPAASVTSWAPMLTPRCSR